MRNAWTEIERLQREIGGLRYMRDEWQALTDTGARLLAAATARAEAAEAEATHLRATLSLGRETITAAKELIVLQARELARMDDGIPVPADVEAATARFADAIAPQPKEPPS